MSYKTFSVLLTGICVFGLSLYARFSHRRLYCGGNNSVYECSNRQSFNIFRSRSVLEDAAGDQNVVNKTTFNRHENMTASDSQPRIDILSTEAEGNQKYLIYSCSGHSPCGGWGDRLRGILSCFVMAQLTNRNLIINMTSPCQLTKWLLPNKVNWLPDVKLRQSNVIFANIQNNARFANMLGVLDLRKLFKNYDVKMRPNYDLFSRLKMNPLYEETLEKLSNPFTFKHAPTLFGDLYEKLFELSPELNQKVFRFLSKTKLLDHHPSLICAQIRMGRNPSIPRDTGTRTNISDLPILWKFLENYTDHTRYKLFVTTDSEEVRREAKFLFPTVIVDTEGPVCHPDFAELSGKGCDGFGKVILDQYLLKHCDTLIISKSLFGVTGAFLRGKNNNFYQFADGRITRKTVNSFQLFN